MMAKIDTNQYVMIRAIVERVTPETVEYKPYRTDLTFDNKLEIEVPVLASEVRKEKDKIILTLKGYKSFLKNYTAMVEELHQEHLHSFMR